jgi:mono/diheme cytochrome c family protein
MRRLVAVSVIGAVVWGAACGSSSSGGGATVTTPDASTMDVAPTPVLPVPSSTDPKVQAGYTAVLMRDCASCHEPSDSTLGVLSGQDTPVAGTTAYGSNLTPDPDTGMDAWTSAQIATALRMGVDDTGSPLCPTMPTYPTMSDTEADDIAAYLQNLTAVHHLITESMCPPIKPAPDAGDDGGDDSGDDGSVEAGDDGGSDVADAGDDGGSDSGDDGGALDGAGDDGG